MTREEAIVVLKNEQPHCGEKALFSEEKKYEAYDVAIKALEQEPCDDCVRRQAVLAIAGDSCLDLDSYEDTREFCDEINDLPPVNPQPKTGHWIYDRTRDWDGECKYECSECGMGSDVDYAYCMRCGAKMESEDK